MLDDIINTGVLDIFIWMFTHGGFLLILWGIIYVAYKLYLRDVRRNYLSKLKWKFLKLTAPRTNEVSMLAIESIFAQMHAVHTTINFYDKYMLGKLQSWYSLEIVSFGGTISLIMRVPEKQLELVKAAFYAQYPECEIKEVDDYMQNIQFDPYDPNCPIDIFGFEWNLGQEDVVPIKTYRDFEHMAAEDKVIDPLSAVWEAMSSIKPYEFYGIQYVIYSVADADWKAKSEAVVQKLLGIQPAKAVGLISRITDLFAKFGKFSLFDLFKTETPSNVPPGPKSFMNLTEMEKEKLTAIQRKAGKAAYFTKLRHLYIAPKDQFDNTQKALLVGAMRNLGSSILNNWKPDTKKTWCDIPVKLSPTLERPYIDHQVKKRKYWFFKGYKERDWDIGLPWQLMNVEELATLYHLPLIKEDQLPPMERIVSKKVAPPTNLPMGNIEDFE